MSNKSIGLSDGLYDYLLANSLREPDILKELREETAAIPYANMQIAPEQGQFMALLVKLTGARRILEIGVFTGYSSLAMALAMPADGAMIACDIDATGLRSRNATGAAPVCPTGSTCGSDPPRQHSTHCWTPAKRVVSI